MATAAVINVLAWVPEIEVERFKPFGFDIAAGGALSLWGVLCAVLVYYFASFGLGVWIEIPQWRSDEHYQLSALKTDLGARANLSRTDGDGRRRITEAIRNRHGLRYSRWRLGADLGVPSAMFLLALWAAISSILALWPANPPGS